MKIVFLVGANGGDYFAIKKAIKYKLIEDVEFAYMLSNSIGSEAIIDFKKENCNYYSKSLEETKRYFFKKIDTILDEISYDYILAVGFDWIIPSYIVDKNMGKIINSHHSLLPSHPGLFKKEKIISTDDKFLGATLHFIDNGMDTGYKLSQAVFPNYKIENLKLILKKYRFSQDCMIVQLLVSLNKQKEKTKVEYYNEILFNPKIEIEILERYYYEK
jgi:phosphoribosylglycinamide formyltransferase-1